jgi:hypothetical protein
MIIRDREANSLDIGISNKQKMTTEWQVEVFPLTLSYAAPEMYWKIPGIQLIMLDHHNNPEIT